VITSMGAGGKSDPTRLRIGTLADCVKDPLASKVKRSEVEWGKPSNFACCCPLK
jgi:tRNA A37 threonylcarbamoyladenosine dehydratase